MIWLQCNMIPTQLLIIYLMIRSFVFNMEFGKLDITTYPLPAAYFIQTSFLSPYGPSSFWLPPYNPTWFSWHLYVKDKFESRLTHRSVETFPNLIFSCSRLHFTSAESPSHLANVVELIFGSIYPDIIHTCFQIPEIQSCGGHFYYIAILILILILMFGNVYTFQYK